mmetsp:Transcript_38972/g.100961  ORF Transcript_38972/g.100961 Transcript_38972/m.100961 type:complete len:273 (+) Transcript_38972:2-820(+)
MGPQVFINLIKRVFVEDGLLRDAARVLVDNIASHLRIVVSHVVDDHAGLHMVLASQLCEKALDVIDIRLEVASKLCDAISEAQQVTSTTHGAYMVKLMEFRKSWFEKTVEDMRQSIQSLFLRGTGSSAEKPELTAEFLDMVQQAQSEPHKFAVLEICASLHVYTSFLIDGFVDMIAKVVKFNMVENLAAKLEDLWRDELAGSTLAELFPKDDEAKQRREQLERTIEQLADFKEQLASLRVASSLPKQKMKPTSFKTRQLASKQAKLAEGALM